MSRANKRPSKSEPSHHELIGQICAAWATLELNFETAIHLLACTGIGIGSCLTSQLGSPHSKLRAVIALCKHHQVSDEIIKRLNQYAKSLHATAEKRNRAVHDVWVMHQHKIIAKYNPSISEALEESKTRASIQHLNDVLVSIQRRITTFREI